MNVVILKMTNGEELLAKETLENGISQYSKVRALRVNNQGEGGLVPWITLNPDAKISISNSNIAAKVLASIEVEKSYLETTSEILLS